MLQPLSSRLPSNLELWNRNHVVVHQGVQCGGSPMPMILVVEDDEQVRVLAESFLQTAGHTTLSAGSVDQALTLLAAPQPIDLLFTDLELQGDPEAGFSLAAKAVELRPDLKILYTSAQGLTDGMNALFVEDSAFLPKPYTVEQLGTMLSMKFDMRSSTIAAPGDGAKPPEKPSATQNNL